jgi:hypothetical protein
MSPEEELKIFTKELPKDCWIKAIEEKQVIQTVQ